MLVRLVSALLVASTVAACSSASESASSTLPKVSEPVAYDASESTKSDTGIVVWGANATADATGADSSTLSGYDSAGAVVAKVEQKIVVVDATHHYFDTTYTAAGGHESAHFRIDGTVGAVGPDGKFAIDLEATENTFPDLPDAASVIAHLQEDLGNSLDATGGADGGGTSLLNSFDLSTADIKPEDSSGGGLVKPSCGGLVKNCGTSMVKIGKPLLPCAGLLNAGRIVLTCAAVGGLAGPEGAVIGGAACALMRGTQIAVGATTCAYGALDTYNNWGSRSQDFKSTCGSALNNGCLTPDPSGGAGIASVEIKSE